MGGEEAWRKFVAGLYRTIHDLRRRIESTNWHLLVLLLAMGLSATGCRYYSFTGASIAPHLETVAVPLALDNTAAPADLALSETLTDMLIDRFVRQTRLSLDPQQDEADVVLTAAIQRYRDEPTAIGGEERAALNRVSITVAVRYYDEVEEEVLLERQFSSSEDYDPADGLQGEIDAAHAALDNIAEDVFTSATSDW